MQRSTGGYHPQLVLELGRSRPPDLPETVNANGVIEALADLLLAALGVEVPAVMGGADEHQDHA